MEAGERAAVARRAAAARWTGVRFGVSRFAELGLPGGELVDVGLAVSLGAPRLRREGVPITIVNEDPEERLYRMLAQSDGNLAHARYNAYLQQLVSFANACRLARIDRR
jgi:hypothetical protein